MLESQLVQLAAVVPPLEKGKILGKSEDLETTNLVDIRNAANYYTQPANVKWIDYSLPDKKGDLGRPIIPISIGCHVLPEVICDFGASVNIMPKVIYKKILGDLLLYTNMHLQLADQSICYPEGVLEEAVTRVGQSYVLVDFVVVDTGGEERAPIILARPFLCIAKAIIYAEHAKIVFSIKDKKKKFSFKEHILHSPTLPQKAFIPEKPAAPVPKKKNFRNWRKTKLSKIPEETVKMINTIRTEYDHLLTPPFLMKKDDLGVPTIECTINQKIFHKTFYDMGSSPPNSPRKPPHTTFVFPKHDPTPPLAAR
jgi:hypothetical protein